MESTWIAPMGFCRMGAQTDGSWSTAGWFSSATVTVATIATATTSTYFDINISTISWHQKKTSPTTYMHILMHISSIKDLYQPKTVYIRPRWQKIAEVDRSPPAIVCHVVHHGGVQPDGSSQWVEARRSRDGHFHFAKYFEWLGHNVDMIGNNKNWRMSYKSYKETSEKTTNSVDPLVVSDAWAIAAIAIFLGDSHGGPRMGAVEDVLKTHLTGCTTERMADGWKFLGSILYPLVN